MAIRTHGSDIGYKNVAVWETGNGKSRFVYSSPIDHPEDYDQQISKRVPVKNLDYKRGLLQHEMHFKEGATVPISETVMKYEITQGEVISGYAIIPNYCMYSYKFSNGLQYYSRYLNCLSPTQPPGCQYIECGIPSGFVGYAPIIEAYGWPKLSSKTSKEYFSNGTVETKEFYTYNSTNKRLATHTVERYNSGGIIDNTVLSYFYKNFGGTNNNISSIERIETVKNGSTLEKKKILYNPQELPGIIQTSKGSPDNYETRINFLQYDTWGHPLTVQ